ncbi:MAG: hypothetical protein AAGF01_08495 [Cyanobacteria bacterium P01_G01_bin.38]
MEENTDQMTTQIDAFKQELAAMRALQERQQESITSLIALSQQQTAVIEQQNAVISRLVVGGNGSVANTGRLVGNSTM